MKRQYVVAFLCTAPGAFMLTLYQAGFIRHPALEARFARWKARLSSSSSSLPSSTKPQSQSSNPGSMVSSNSASDTTDRGATSEPPLTGAQEVFSLEELRQATRGRSYLLFIHAPWCGYCVQYYAAYREIAQHVNKANAADSSRQWACLHYDEKGSPAQSPFLREFDARTLPTLIIGHDDQWARIQRGQWTEHQTIDLLTAADRKQLFKS